jgi:plasmid stabilization system protein ParE
MNFRILAAAACEYRAAYRHYCAIRPELGLRFKQAFNSVVDRILDRPSSGTIVGRVVRLCRFKRFQYGVVYLPRETEIVVGAVMHRHRRPRYWKRRLKDVGP